MDRSFRLVWNGIRKTPSTLAWVSQSLATLQRYRRDERLTVAVDIAAFWEPLTGIGWYLFRLLEHLADRQDIRLLLFSPTIVRSPDLEPPTVAPPVGDALEMVHYDISSKEVLFAGTVTRLLRRLEPLLIAAHGSQVLFAPNYFLPRRFSLARGSLVATIHDLGFRAVPWTLREETLQELAEQLDRTLEKSDRLITVSSAVRDELIRDGYPRPDRIQVVHHGPGQLATVSANPLPAVAGHRFALHVGTLEPRKNIEGLLACWRLVREQMQDPPLLILVGKYGWKTEAIRSEVEKAEAAGWLRHLGYVSEPELAALYQSAQLVLFPSLYEGFGLPAVEAQWAGTPLICSDLPVLREVAGDGALFAPSDRPDLFAAEVMRVLANRSLAQELSRKGKAHASRLSWDRAAEETLAVWRRATAESS
jgi:glycosyltransferase involved in cell wall biosynthesis